MAGGGPYQKFWGAVYIIYIIHKLHIYTAVVLTSQKIYRTGSLVLARVAAAGVHGIVRRHEVDLHALGRPRCT